MTSWDSTVLEVALAAPLRETRIVTEPLHDPGEGGLVLVVERFGLSGNNITYAQLGDRFGLGYWRPFPAGDGWGRVPAWGVARVVAGDPALADVGDRFVGFVPMADHVVLRAARTSTGLRDTSPEREGLLPMYRDMRRVGTDPTWREDLLGVNLALRPAYPAAALLDDELRQDGAAAVVLTSATSKTALTTARLLTERGVRTTGLTSARHVDAAASTGAYTSVRSYDDVAALPVQPTVLLDVAGNPTTTRAVHDRLGADLRRSISVGGTHHDAAAAEDDAPRLVPEPEQFNTGGREVELARERGEREVLRLQDAARDALVPWAAGWMDIRTVTGPQDVEQEWHRLVDGPGVRSPLSGTTASV